MADSSLARKLEAVADRRSARSRARPLPIESVIAQIDAHDRALFMRCVVPVDSTGASRAFWTLVTHIGGVWCSVLAAALPIIAGGAPAAAGFRALLTLGLSHIVVQVIKRGVGRPRPTRTTSCAALVAEPDRFSFPSGHACAAMSVAFVYAAAFPSLAVPLLAGAVIIGFSRVCLAVHYPGDVLIGQGIAILTGLLVMAV